MRFNVLEALRTYSIQLVRNGDNFVVLCPFHEDHNPSGQININTGRFTCWACKHSTNFYGYLSKKLGLELRDIYYAIGRTYYLEKDNAINPHDIQSWHVAIFNNSTFLQELEYRCVNEELIRQHRLGVAFDRISIPIYNEIGEAVNTRLYLPGAKKDKFLNLRGRGRSKTRLYPIEQLGYDAVLLCGGEIKAIAAAKVLNPYGIGAITATCGENTWDIKLNGYFEDKVVYVNCDIDKIGEESAEKRCRLLKSSVRELYKLTLPLDNAIYPKGDINDFLRIGGNLYEEIEKCEVWKLNFPIEIENDDNEPLDVDLDSAVSANLAKKRIKVKVIVSSKDTSPYSIPKEFEIRCSKSETFCKICPIYLNYPTIDKPILTLNKERIEVIEMVGQELKKQHTVFKKLCGIPQKCGVVDFTPLTFHHVEDVRVSQQIDIMSRNSERSMQIAYCVGEQKLDLNECYAMIGRMYPHPSNQQAALLISEYEATQDALSSYIPTDLDSLQIFQPSEWTEEGLRKKLKEIYEDFEANVTNIYSRHYLHLMIDLAYHSPLFIKYGGKYEKGWVETLVIGDSSQGKSRTIEMLLNHYKLGERVICKGATAAGLLGGVQQYGKRWFASWGKIPTHDRRLVILDELKGASVEVIAALTDMRSSGIAELTKIEKRRTNARTRIIAISNPRSDRPISSYNYGIDTVKELIGNPEDIRRFDAVLLLNKNEIDIELLQKYKPIVEHKYTSELCRELILFSWTISEVEFEDEDIVNDSALYLCNLYSDDIPIIDRGSTRFKIARLAASLAARTFSVKDEETLFVRNCHVELIKQLLIDIYSNPTFGYAAYSQKIFESNKLVNPEAIRSKLKNGTPYPQEFITHLIMTEEIDLQFIQDTLAWNAQDARDLLAFLVRHHALRREYRIYRKTEGFTELLKKMEKEEKYTVKPGFLGEEF